MPASGVTHGPGVPGQATRPVPTYGSRPTYGVDDETRGGWFGECQAVSVCTVVFACDVCHS